MHRILSPAALAGALAALLLAALAGCGPQFKRADITEYTPKYHTTAHKMLALEADFGADAADMRLLDQVIGEAAEYIEVKPAYSKVDALYILRTINVVIIKSFTYSQHRFLSRGFKKNELDCDLLTAIYISIGEVLNLPLHGVVVPRHSFVRWVLPGGYIDWEATSGHQMNDAHYISGDYLTGGGEGFYDRDRFDLSGGIASGAYMRTLSTSEFMAVPYHNLASGYMRQETDPANTPRQRAVLLRKAETAYDQALALDPRRPEAYMGRALVFMRRGNVNLALDDLDRAVGLSPGEPELRYWRGRLLLGMGRYGQAADEFKQTLELNPEYKQAYFWLGMSLSRSGHPEEGAAWMKKARETGLILDE